MVEEKSAGEAQVSTSKARRQRAAALRKQLWKAVQDEKIGAAGDGTENSAVASMCLRLAFLESLVMDMHWITVGQWRMCSDISGASMQADTPVSPSVSTGNLDPVATSAEHAWGFSRQTLCSGM